jgi:hypothetical protein
MQGVQVCDKQLGVILSQEGDKDRMWTEVEVKARQEKDYAIWVARELKWFPRYYWDGRRYDTCVGRQPEWHKLAEDRLTVADRRGASVFQNKINKERGAEKCRLGKI